MKWLPEALDDLTRLYEFLYSLNPAAAARAAQAIADAAQMLDDNPAIGRPMHDERGHREWFVSFGAGSYVLRYALDKNSTLTIIRVWHSREDRN